MPHCQHCEGGDEEHALCMRGWIAIGVTDAEAVTSEWTGLLDLVLQKLVDALVDQYPNKQEQVIDAS